MWNFIKDTKGPFMGIFLFVLKQIAKITYILGRNAKINSSELNKEINNEDFSTA